MFYLTSDATRPYGPLTVDNYYNASSVPLTLSAPTSGTYLGVLFFQNRSITKSVASSNPNSIAGGIYMTLTGSLYFPTTSVSFQNSNLAMTMAVVADTVSFLGGDQNTVLYDPTGLKTGLFTKSVAMVQ